MNESERKLFKYFAKNYPRPECPDDLSLVEYAEGFSKNPSPIASHLEDCIVCQTQLREITKVQQTGRIETEINSERDIDREKIYARLSAKVADADHAVPELSLAADTAKSERMDLSFGSSAGDIVVRCRKVNKKSSEFNLIWPGFKQRTPVLIVINGLIVKALYANKPTLLPGISLKKDSLNTVEIVEPAFNFSGLSNDLVTSLDENYRFVKVGSHEFSIESAKKDSAENSYYIRHQADTLLLERLPLSCEFDEDIVLLFYDLSKNITRLENLN